MKVKLTAPKWSKPLFNPYRYKGVKGGRGSGKSHFLAELLVFMHVTRPNFQSVCIREIQKSLKFSAKKLIEEKIDNMGVSHLFDITLSEIRRVDGKGLIIFQGMQDHTADSIKSLEGFDLAWVEEAQSISARSMELLLPTIRKEDSEIWFSWNPYQDDDPIEKHFSIPDEDSIVIHVNYTENPFLPDVMRKEAERHKRVNPDTFGHVWLGEFSTRSDAIVFNGKYKVAEFEPESNWQPLYGLDWGFANDPTAAVEIYVNDGKLWIRREAGKVGLELDDTAIFIKKSIPKIDKYVIRADCARPESISHVRRKGLPKIEPCKKWSGSVEDGVEYMRSLDGIIIHPDCRESALEFRRYSYKVHKQTGDIMPDIVDDWNHYIDAIRYALGNLIRPRGAAVW